LKAERVEMEFYPFKFVGVRFWVTTCYCLCNWDFAHYNSLEKL